MERERGRQKVGNSREEKTKKNGKCARLNVEKNFGNAFAVKIWFFSGTKI